MIDRSGFAGAALAGAVLFAAGTAFAAPAPQDRETTKVAEAAPVHAVSESEDDAANCSKSRKRLWVENEGWIVRKVTVCR